MGHGVRRLFDRKRIRRIIRLRPERVMAKILVVITFFAAFTMSFKITKSFAEPDESQLYADSTSCTFTKIEEATHQATISPGTEAEEIGTTKIVTKCPNSLDHQVYAVGYTNETEGNTNLKNTSNNSVIPTGTESGNVSNWSMKISKDNTSYSPENLTIENGYNSYSEIPSTPEMISNYNGGTDSETGSAITTTYKVSSATDQVAGDYIGTVKYTLTATMLYNITIAPTSGISKVTLNNVDCTLKTGCLVENLTSGQSYTLTATLEDGYSFVRWNPGKEGEVAGPTSASTTYTVGDGNSFISPIAEMGTRTVQIKYGEGIASTTVNGNSVANNGTVSLANNTPLVINPVLNTGYALTGYTFPPLNATTSTLEANAMQTIQNLKYSECSSTPKQVYDTRDGQLYTVAKLADGNCWMIDNLNLGAITLVTDLTSSNTNINETVSASTFNSWKTTSGASPTKDNGVFTQIAGTDQTSGSKKGTLYNYYAATAGTVSGDINTSDAEYDICPAGWRLPTGNATGEFTALYNNEAYNSLENIRKPIAEGGAAFAIPGFFSSTWTSPTNGYGFYWSSSRNNATSIYTLFMTTSSVNPAYLYSDRSSGDSIRCILKKPKHNVKVQYGTGVTEIKINGGTVSNGQSVQLEEGETYTIQTTTNSGYTLEKWESTSGDIEQYNITNTTYTVGTTSDTISSTAVPDSQLIQNISASDCTSTASIVYDSRDMQSYIIKRLDDGRCWMMENLNLGAEPLTGDLTANNTDTNTTISRSTFESWKKTQYEMTYDAGEYIVQTGSDATSGNRYGTLYNYYAISAGKISGNINTENSYYDICPAGWRLPTNTEYSTLYSNYHSLELMRKSESEGGAAFAYAGRVNISGNVEAVNNSGSYWESVRSSDTEMRYLFISSGGSQIYSADSMIRSRGMSARCIYAEKTISNLTYLQDFKSLAYADILSIRSSMSANTNYNLTDGRDNKSYKIAKLLDGNIWLAENLDLGRTSISNNLTSDNTNIKTTISSTTFNGWKDASFNTARENDGAFISISGTDSVSNEAFGTLYNYYAASGGTVSGSDVTITYSEQDICPAGWRMPTGGPEGEYAEMYSHYNTNDLVRKPITQGGANLPFSGRIWVLDNSLQYTNTYGYYNSASFTSGGTLAYFRVFSGGATINDSTGRTTGCAIRCIAKKILEPTL